jgi:hypothetical protein
MKRPQLINSPNIQPIVKAIREYLDFIESAEYNEDEVDDYEYEITETAMTCLFGEKIFDYINELI